MQPTTPGPVLRSLATLLLTLAAAGCGDDAAAPPVPARLAALSPLTDVAMASDTTADTLVVRVEDRRGRGVPDVPVRWEVVEGDGTLSTSGTASAADGTARTVLRGGTGAGPRRVVARSEGLEPVAFVRTVEPGPPARLVLVSGDAQEGEVGLPLPDAIVVRVEDRWGNGVPGAGVSFQAEMGSASPTEAATDVEGRVSAAWTLGPAAGSQVLAAGVPGVDSVRVTAVAAPGPAAELTLLPDAALVDAGGVVWLEAAAVDRFGNPTSTEGAEWSAEPAGALVVLQEGVVRALEVGEGRVRAAVGDAVAEAIVRVGEPRAPLAAGFSHTCALIDGLTRCWGSNGAGELGTGAPDTMAHVAPALVAGPSFRWVSAGFHHTCALESGGAAWCWGSNEWGQLGGGDTLTRARPSPVGGPPLARVAAGAGPFTCALALDGGAWCWGANHLGQLGDGTHADRSLPNPVATADRFVDLAAGAAHACAITAAGEAWCWGANFVGQLGTGDTVGAAAPRPVAGGHRFASLGAGAWHTCGVTLAREVLCWGDQQFAQTGAGAPGGFRTTPERALADGVWDAVRAGEHHTCALTADGAASCWGSRGFGGLGDGGSAGPTSPPRPVSGGLVFTRLATGGFHTCGVTAADDLWCWGWNERGQVGDGTTADRTVPTPVLER